MADHEDRRWFEGWLKSDYFRIEIRVSRWSANGAAGLKSDYFRIEIKLTKSYFNDFSFVAKIRLF